MVREEGGLWMLHSLGGRVDPLLGESSTPREKARWKQDGDLRGPRKAEDAHPWLLLPFLRGDSTLMPQEVRPGWNKSLFLKGRFQSTWLVLLLLDAWERILGEAQLGRRPGVLEGPQGSVWRDVGWPPGHSRSRSGGDTRASPQSSQSAAPPPTLGLAAGRQRQAGGNAWIP